MRANRTKSEGELKNVCGADPFGQFLLIRVVLYIVGFKTQLVMWGKSNTC